MRLTISKQYGKQVVFDDFTLEAAEGEIVCVLGESGGGKTTLLNALAGLIAFDGKKTDVPDGIGYVFQTPRLLPNLTVAENLRYVGGEEREIERILHKTELYEHRNKRPKQLSGGEKQRVALARAFLRENGLLLFDEPFSSLDTALKIRLYKEFIDLWQEKRPTTIFVTHDLEEACALAHRIVVLKKGKAVANVEMPQGGLPREYGIESAEKMALLQALLRS